MHKKYHYDIEITIDKDDFDASLKSQNISQVQNVCSKMTLSMMCAMFSENERIRLIHKGGEKFFHEILELLENQKAQEMKDNPNYTELLFTQNTTKRKVDNQRKEKNLTRLKSHHSYTNDLKYSTDRRELLVKEFKNKYYDFFFDNITINPKNIAKIMLFDMNTKQQNKFARLCVTSTKDPIAILEKVFSSAQYQKMSKHHFIRHAANATKDLEVLKFLLKSDPQSFHKGFQTMLDKNEFWHDLKPDPNRVNFLVYHPSVNNTKHIEKVIWLEKNKMGYIKNNMQYLISFLCSIDTENIEKYMEAVNSKKVQKYLEKSIDRYLNYINKPGDFSDKITKRISKSITQYEDIYSLSPYSSELPPEIESKIKAKENMILYIKEIMLYESKFRESNNNISNNLDRINLSIKYRKIREHLEQTLDNSLTSRKTNKI